MNSELLRWCEPKVILVATRLFEEPALMQHAKAQARRSGARVLLVHVLAPPVAGSPGATGAGRVLPLPSLRTAREVLESMALQFQWQGYLCEPILLTGRPSEQIAALVRSRNVDRVLVAARHVNRHEPTHPSLAEQLTASIPVPVCIIGRQPSPGPFGDGAAGRVLLALSLRSDSQPYVEFACCFARERQARLTLLHVLDGAAESEHDREQAQVAARTRLAALAAAEGGQAEIAIREGDVATRILEEAVCPSQDFILLGAPSRSPESSIVRRVIAETRCPLLTLKPPVALRARADLALSELKTGS